MRGTLEDPRADPGLKPRINTPANLGVTAQNAGGAVMARHTGHTGYTGRMWKSFPGDAVSMPPKRQPRRIGANHAAAWSRNHPAA